MSLSNVRVQRNYNSSQGIGRSLGLSGTHLSKIILFEKLEAEKNEKKLEAAEERVTTLEKVVTEIPVSEDTRVALQPEEGLKEISNTEINSELQDVSSFDPVMTISPESEMDSISPVEEQSVEEPVDDNSLNNAIENAKMAGDPFAQEPIVPGQSSVNDGGQTEFKEEKQETTGEKLVSLDSSDVVGKTSTLDLGQLMGELNDIRNNIISLVDRACVIVNNIREIGLNNEATAEMLNITKTRFEEVQREMSTAKKEGIIIQDAPDLEEGPTLSLQP